jgi:hypothetical protein
MDTNDCTEVDPIDDNENEPLAGHLGGPPEYIPFSLTVDPTNPGDNMTHVDVVVTTNVAAPVTPQGGVPAPGFVSISYFFVNIASITESGDNGNSGPSQLFASPLGGIGPVASQVSLAILPGFKHGVRNLLITQAQGVQRGILVIIATSINAGGPTQSISASILVPG